METLELLFGFVVFAAAVCGVVRYVKYREANKPDRKTGPGSRIDGGGTPPKVP